jgi:hypothetical protein
MDTSCQAPTIGEADCLSVCLGHGHGLACLLWPCEVGWPSDTVSGRPGRYTWTQGRGHSIIPSHPTGVFPDDYRDTEAVLRTEGGRGVTGILVRRTTLYVRMRWIVEEADPMKEPVDAAHQSDAAVGKATRAEPDAEQKGEIGKERRGAPATRGEPEGKRARASATIIRGPGPKGATPPRSVCRRRPRRTGMMTAFGGRAGAQTDSADSARDLSS